MRVLAGDVGGTHTRLALFEATGERLQGVARERFKSARYEGLTEIVCRFLDRQGGCEAACFGLAGPVRGRVVRITNLPWVVDADQIASAARIPRVYLRNDLVVGAWGIETLEPEDVLVLRAGERQAEGNRALIAAGTGLGEAGLVWDGSLYRPCASEAGHTDFAARTDLEIELLRHLQKRWQRVSWERVLSGPGLVHIYEFLVEDRGAETPDWLAEEMESGDPGAVITRAGQEGRCELCREALDHFVRIYGAETGNVALRYVATGGVYVGGGIAPKIREELLSPLFLDPFLDKGRMRSLVASMPLELILGDDLGLRGAARYALLRGAEAGSPDAS